MYKVRGWAHRTAHGQTSWTSGAKALISHNDEPRDAEQQTEGEADYGTTKPKQPLGRYILHNLKVIILTHKWLNVFLIFVPAGIAVKIAGVDSNVVFALNAIAVIPLAGTLTFATEALASKTSPTIAALLNVSFGNSVELIIFIIALIQNQIRIVQASLVGSILANLLLILGMAMTFGGLQYQEQIYDNIVTQMNSSLLVLSVLSLLIPTVFHASFSDQNLADIATVKISRGVAVILLLIYVLYLIFQLKSHAYLYAGTPQHVIDEQTLPGILQTMNDDSSSSSSSSSSSRRSSMSSISTQGSDGFRRRFKRKAKAKLGRRRSARTEEVLIEEDEEINTVSGGLVTAEPESLPDEKAEQSAHNTLETSETPTQNAVPAKDTEVSNGQTNPPRRPLIGRGITIRPPPVFRAESQANHLAQQQQFQLRNRHALTAPGELRRFSSAPNMHSAHVNSQPGVQAANSQTRSGTGFSSGIEQQASGIEHVKENEPPLDTIPALLLLLVSTALVAVCAEFMVSSIEHLVETSPLSEAFIGLVLLPIVGNAAEHVTAVIVACRNKMDLAIGVALGSSIQIALFITPLVVIIGWIADKGMTLYFTLFETVSVFAAVFIVCFLCLDGRSNYLEGVLLCGAYVIVCVGAFFFPDSENTNTFIGGSGS